MITFKEIPIPDYRKAAQNEMVNYRTQFYETSDPNRPHQMIHFDNVSDMIECCTNNSSNGTWDDKGHEIGHRPDWTFGDDFPDVDSTHTALMGGIIPQKIIDKIDSFKADLYKDHPELFELEASANRLRRRRVFSEEGDELNIDRYMGGDPYMWQRMTRRPEKQSIKIMINACMNAGFASGRFQSSMTTLTALIDILDRAGINSEIWYAPISEYTASGVELAGVFCRIKGPEEPLDICKMLSCGAPGLFRYYTFKTWVNLLRGTPHHGLGRMVESSDKLELVKNINGFDLMINANNSPEDTFKIISTTIKDLFNN
jgi:hypothetical protein